MVPRRHPADRPLPPEDPFHLQVQRLIAVPRQSPAQNTRPPGNPPIDRRAVARVARMLHTLVG
jgi:hypothetical protein